MSKLTTSKTTTRVIRTKANTPKPKTIVEEPEPVVTEPVVEPVVETVAETVAETSVMEETVEVESMRQRFDKLIKSKQDLMNDLKKEIQELRKMQRDHEHELKDASKKTKKKKSRDENSTRKPSGFASPVVVSDVLYEFLVQFGVKKGDPIARTDVTRYITTYIKDHDLQNPEHRREILPDAALKKLFGPAMEPKDPSDANSPLVYTYLKLQRYLSQHFPKKATV